MDNRPDFDREQWKFDNAFGNDKYYLDDRFVLNDGKKHKFAVICPGGGYEVVCSFIEGAPFARKLNEKGISAFIVYYRCKTLYPAPQDDLAEAVKEIFHQAEKYNLDTENYSVWGSSAGGHLAASFCLKEIGYEKYGLPKPGALVLAYPVVSMKKEITHPGSHNQLLGENPDKETEKMTSIEEQAQNDFPPAFFWCGKNDDCVKPLNSIKLAERLKKAGVRYSFTLYDDAPHGIGPGTGTEAEGWIDKAVEFWLK